jgi:hypothetical protein
MGDDIPIDSETLLVTDFVNFKIKSAPSFRGANRDRMCVCVFIGMSARMCISICICTVFKKNTQAQHAWEAKQHTMQRAKQNSAMQRAMGKNAAQKQRHAVSEGKKESSWGLNTCMLSTGEPNQSDAETLHILFTSNSI